jgi:hypothetical protein
MDTSISEEICLLHRYLCYPDSGDSETLTTIYQTTQRWHHSVAQSILFCLDFEAEASGHPIFQNLERIRQMVISKAILQKQDESLDIPSFLLLLLPFLLRPLACSDEN